MLADYNIKVSEVASTTSLDALINWITPEKQRKDYE